MTIAPITKQEVLERLKSSAFNSSHFVWMISELSFFKSSNDWLFAFNIVSNTAVLALEPLPPQNEPLTDTGFVLAWADYCKRYPEIKRAVFAGIYSDFSKVLERHGFQSVGIGKDPWVSLDNYFPTGNHGKGVRAAKNQAVRAGVWTEEWHWKSLIEDKEKRETLLKICHYWTHSTLLKLRGFMLSNAPLEIPEQRRYFVARTKNRVIGYLIVTPISQGESFYFEDMMFLPDAERGASELLLLDTMETLKQSGAQEVSLGVIALKEISSDGAAAPKKSFLRIVKGLQLFFTLFYNSKGIELYRKRFKPKKWMNIHMAVSTTVSERKTSTSDWLIGILAILRAFKPTIVPSLSFIFQKISRVFNRYPLTLFFLTLISVPFAKINKFQNLPQPILDKYGFTVEAPTREWLRRGLTADFLCYDLKHFLILFLGMLVVLPFLERRYKRWNLAAILAVLWLNDDFLNYIFIIKPLEIWHTRIYSLLLSNIEVGCSLTLAALFGCVLAALKTYRDVLLGVISVGMVLVLMVTSPRFYQFAININHFLFVVIGFLGGRVRAELIRKQNQSMSKQKTPVKLVSRPWSRTKGPAG